MAACWLVVMLGAAGRGNDVAAGLVDFQQGHFAEALRDWQRADDHGDSRGALYIGVLYDTGLGVQQDYPRAMAWYKRAADQGNAAAAFNVGVLYDSGLGVAKSPSEAAIWYAVAAKRNYARADYNLAMLYENGTGVRRDKERAVALYKQAAALGISAARKHLAALGQSFIAKKPTPAPDTLQDFAMAQQMIVSRSPQQVAQAAALLQKSADRRNALAEYDLGYCYEHGLGVARDLPRAIIWYQRASADTKEDSLRTLTTSSIRYLQLTLAREKPP